MPSKNSAENFSDQNNGYSIQSNNLLNGNFTFDERNNKTYQRFS